MKIDIRLIRLCLNSPAPFQKVINFLQRSPARKEKKSAPEPSAGDKKSVIALLVEARFMRGARTGRKRKKRWLSE